MAKLAGNWTDPLLGAITAIAVRSLRDKHRTAFRVIGARLPEESARSGTGSQTPAETGRA